MGKSGSIFILFHLFAVIVNGLASETFLEKQKRFERVCTAFREKESVVKNMFTMAKARFPEPQIFIRIFKLEKTVELWAKSAQADTLILINTYKICATCGSLGPKRKQGDLQIPEGFYYINGFNPVSMFYLSLRINYPNASDRILGQKGNLGGDIFIHGNCVTLGCIPITDDKIKELYLICLLAKAGNNDIPVHIFPFRFNKRYNYLLNTHQSRYKTHVKFWENLKTGFEYFETHHKLLQINVDHNSGFYKYKKQSVQ